MKNTYVKKWQKSNVLQIKRLESPPNNLQSTKSHMTLPSLGGKKPSMELASVYSYKIQTATQGGKASNPNKKLDWRELAKVVYDQTMLDLDQY
jgi:hypothetical protein